MMKILKLIRGVYRYYFNKKIQALKNLKEALVYDYNHQLLDGMCLTATDNKDITDDEYSILMPIIIENKPEMVFELYYFPPGVLQPRLDWCDEVINKLKYDRV